jgi:hypothetical protein
MGYPRHDPDRSIRLRIRRLSDRQHGSVQCLTPFVDRRFALAAELADRLCTRDHAPPLRRRVRPAPSELLVWCVTHAQVSRRRCLCWQTRYRPLRRRRRSSPTAQPASEMVGRVGGGRTQKLSSFPLSDTPSGRPTKLVIVISLRTAKALGLEVPLDLQQLGTSRRPGGNHRCQRGTTL